MSIFITSGDFKSQTFQKISLQKHKLSKYYFLNKFQNHQTKIPTTKKITKALSKHIE